mmetsp:Transcript_2315/g.5023  ORF Transcript_2315/g.5023 Transcript_2315/m.5023 type:complete len:100 (-) Transcript_2315:297-596(-)
METKIISSRAFFSKGMYTAYIIHCIFPLPVAFKCFIFAVEKAGALEYDDSGSSDPLETMYTTNEDFLFPGWLLVSVIALVITWLLAWAIRSIPGFSHVL